MRKKTPVKILHIWIFPESCQKTNKLKSLIRSVCVCVCKCVKMICVINWCINWLYALFPLCNILIYWIFFPFFCRFHLKRKKTSKYFAGCLFIVLDTVFCPCLLHSMLYIIISFSVDIISFYFFLPTDITGVP